MIFWKTASACSSSSSLSRTSASVRAASKSPTAWTNIDFIYDSPFAFKDGSEPPGNRTPNLLIKSQNRQMF